jgi:fucose permease
MGSNLGISVPISFGLPLMVVGLALVIAAARVDSTLFWILGLAGMGLGLLLFSTGKTL